MAVVSGTVHSVRTMESGAWDPDYQLAEVLFTVSGTYAQADNAILAGVPTLIQNSRRNGKTVTMRAVMAGRPATRADTNANLTVKGAAISTNDVTFEVALANWSTEFTDATAVPSQNRPFSILVAFTEA